MRGNRKKISPFFDSFEEGILSALEETPVIGNIRDGVFQFSQKDLAPLSERIASVAAEEWATDYVHLKTVKIVFKIKRACAIYFLCRPCYICLDTYLIFAVLSLLVTLRVDGYRTHSG